MMPSHAYHPHAAFIAPAVPQKALWRLILGVVLAFVGYMAGIMLMFGIVQRLRPDDPYYLDALAQGATPAHLFLLLASFIFMILPVVAVARLLHKRGFLSLLGPMPLAIRQFMRVFGPLLILGLVLFALPILGLGVDLTPNLAPGLWALLLPLSLVLVLIQVSAEEIAFRGYLQQQLAARFRSPFVWMVLPSVLFAFGHYLPEEAGENAWIIALWSGVFGMLMADITARSGSLGPAIALHFYNNITAMLIVSMPDSLSGLALFHGPFGIGDVEQVRAWLPVDFVHMFVAWLVARVVLKR